MKPSASAPFNPSLIAWEDNHVLVAVKPSGLPTQPAGGAEDLQTLCKAYIKEKYRKAGAVFLEPIHRLDRPVSGLVIFARTSKALSRLQEAMRQGTICKYYAAWIEGVIEPPYKKLSHFLVHGDHSAHVGTSQTGKLALLTYQRLHVQSDRSFLTIELHTGRYHQIRCQLAAEGHPLVGDTRYGSRHPIEQGILLHAYRVDFPHPTLHNTLTVLAPLPPAWPEGTRCQMLLEEQCTG
jgi:23S rRNA pseudouridine1911/1915/1917 synthase